MNILITGATGNVGKQMVHYLSEIQSKRNLHYNIIIADRKAEGSTICFIFTVCREIREGLVCPTVAYFDILITDFVFPCKGEYKIFIIDNYEPYKKVVIE